MSKKMKSAFELAMERLEKSSGPARKLNDEQRDEIAQIENVYEAKIAETKLEFEQKMVSAGSMEDLENLRQQLAQRLAELEAERDKKKETIWAQAE